MLAMLAIDKWRLGSVDQWSDELAALSMALSTRCRGDAALPRNMIWLLIPGSARRSAHGKRVDLDSAFHRDTTVVREAFNWK